MAFLLNRLVRPAAIVAVAACGFGGAAQAQSAAGMLECNVSGGTGFIITSSKALDCYFLPSGGAPRERYLGTINRFGLDIGVTGPGKLAWGVLAPGGGVPAPGALQGVYSGVGGGATVGAGATANVLVGGNGSNLSLQPLSVSGQIGLNFTAGVGQITLDYVPSMAPAPMMKKKKKKMRRPA